MANIVEISRNFLYNINIKRNDAAVSCKIPIRDYMLPHSSIAALEKYRYFCAILLKPKRRFSMEGDEYDNKFFERVTEYYKP